ncbi:DUF1653 domain-containing protein [Synechococcus elongatus]|uniref:DUF1653 domain-containing protein n=1 Tax=Synechococcus elongatus TaxID=32046 RepID=UPI003BF8218C
MKQRRFLMTQDKVAIAREMLKQAPQRGSRWINKKTGRTYVIIDVGFHSETEEPLVVYRVVAPQTHYPAIKRFTWIRPLSVWEKKFYRAED